MDYVEHFRREVRSFATAARQAVGADPAPAVPSCPGWSMTDLVLHLGYVHRLIARVISERLKQAPTFGDLSWLGLPAEQEEWLAERMAQREQGRTAVTPSRRPLPAPIVDWFGAGAAELERQFVATSADEPVWTWGTSQTEGFWQRMQAIEAAIHRWDAENAIGGARPMDAELAADAIVQTFEVMAPMRRASFHAPPGNGERFRFTRTDGPGDWVVRFDGDLITLGEADEACDIAMAGTVSDLMLFLWHRLPSHALDVQGDAQMADRYFDLVPPL